MGDGNKVESVGKSTARRLADLVNGVELASEDDLRNVAQGLGTTAPQVAPLVGRLRDDDDRASAPESRAALAWIERTKRPGLTLDAFRRHVDTAASARTRAREALAARAGTGRYTDGAYRELIAFVERHPKLPLDAAVDAYLTVLTAVPVEQKKGNAVTRAWDATANLLRDSPADRALEGLRVAHEASVTMDRDIQLAARVYASVMAYGSATEAEDAVRRGLGRIVRTHPGVPIEDLTNAWIGLIAAHRSVERAEAALDRIERITPDKAPPNVVGWMRAYALIQSSEGRDQDNLAVIDVLEKAPRELTRNPEALAIAYKQVLASEHGATAAALHAMSVLCRWAPADPGIVAIAGVHQSLRRVVGHTEALARTLYLLERAGTPIRLAALNSLAAAEVEDARVSRTALEQLGSAVRELPLRALGWLEGKGAPEPAAPPVPPPSAASATRSPNAKRNTKASPMEGGLPQLTGPAQAPEGLAIYAPGSVYKPRSDAAIDLFERAAVLAGVPKAWAKSEGLHNILDKESRGGVVGIPNYTYGRGLGLDRWKAIHADLRNGIIKAKSSATGLGQLLLRNVDVYYPAGRDGIGIPLQEAAGMLAYIKDRYGNPDNAWRLYGTRHEGY